MRVHFVYSRLSVSGIDFYHQKIKEKLIWIQTEKEGENNNELCSKILLIEVKTTIPSLGELFRQLNTYKEYVKGDYIVVCPDDSNKETIISQGYKFYKYQ